MLRDPREMARDAVRRACQQCEADKEEQRQAELRTATIIENNRRQDEARRQMARNVIVRAKKDFARRYPRNTQGNRILKTLRDARELLNDIQEMTQEKTPEKLGRLMRYRPHHRFHHRFCLISCGPDCPAPLHEELAPKKQPSLFYLHESKWKQ